MRNVKDKVVLITGANRPSGIGQALVLEAIKRGAKKIYATARDTGQLNALVTKHPEHIIPVTLDITNDADIQKATADLADTDILINNAGVSLPFHYTDAYDAQKAKLEMEVNCFGPMHLTQALIKHLINNQGAVVNILSLAALAPAPDYMTYSASKAAAHSWTQSLRIMMMPKGVAVFGIFPGPIETDMTAALNVPKATPASVATRVFDGMEQGSLDITTDSLSDLFTSYLQHDPKPMQQVQAIFDQNT